MYFLQNNIEIVRGAKRHCIYDFNANKLFALDTEDLDVLQMLLQTTDIPDSAVTGNVLSTKNYLINAGIIVTENDLLPKKESKEYTAAVDFAWIEITQNCNLICRHCYEGSSRTERHPEMPYEQFVRVVEKLKHLGVDRIQLVGGEPLMHSQIKRLIEHITGKFSFIEVFTNGTLLTEDMLDFMKAHGISLAFSVYSDTASLHDYVTRTTGSYEKTLHHIRQATEQGIDVRISSVEMKNIPAFQMDELESVHKTDLPRLTGRADISLYNRDMLKRKLITKATFQYPISMDDFYRNKSIHNCFGERLYIDYCLNVYPCAMERRACYGNIAVTDLDEIMSAALPRMTKDKIEGCKDCEYRYACYDCRCDANNAAITAKPWYCTYNQEEGVWLDEDQFIDVLLSNAQN